MLVDDEGDEIASDDENEAAQAARATAAESDPYADVRIERQYILSLFSPRLTFPKISLRLSLLLRTCQTTLHYRNRSLQKHLPN